MAQNATLGMLVLLFITPLSAAAGEVVQPTPMMEPDRLERMFDDANVVIEQCRRDRDCAGHVGRERLARAFLVHVVHSSVFQGHPDPASAASASYLDPDLAVTWGIHEPVDTAPHSWISRRFEPFNSEAENNDIGASTTGDDWESVTWTVGLDWVLPRCDDFSTTTFEGDLYSGEECLGTITGTTQAVLRPLKVLSLQPFLSIGDAYNTDMEALHVFDQTVPGPEKPFHQVVAEAGMLVGVATPTPGGEFRIGVGPLFHTERVSAETRDRLNQDYEIALDHEGGFSPGLRVGLELDGKLGRVLRMGPRLHVDVRNEASLFPGESGEGWGFEDAELLNRDVELVLRPSAAFSLPSSGPAAFHLEAGVEVSIDRLYSQAVKEELQTTFGDVSELEQVRVTAPTWLHAGVEFRF